MFHCVSFFFFFTDPATTEIYTLSLHDALPIYRHPLAIDCAIEFVDLAAVEQQFARTLGLVIMAVEIGRAHV